MDTKFPLLELSRLVCALSVLDSVHEGNSKLGDPLLGPKARGIKIEESLSHSAAFSEIADLIPPSSFAHHLLASDYDTTLAKLINVAGGSGEEGGETSADSRSSTEARVHSFTFGVEMDVALRSSRKPVALRERVKEMGGGRIQFGVPSGETNVAEISHGYAALARGMMFSALSSSSSASSPDPASTNAGDSTAKTTSMIKPLPGRVCADPAMVNTAEVRAAFLPSFNAFSTAASLCDLISSRIRDYSSSSTLLEEISRPRTREEKNVVFPNGRVWGLGFCLRQLKNGRIGWFLID